MPIAVQIKLNLIFSDFVFNTDNSFIDNTGKTHGIKFKIKPPNKTTGDPKPKKGKTHNIVSINKEIEIKNKFEFLSSIK